MKPREDRLKVLLPARMCAEGGWTDVRVRDLSSRGLQLHAQYPLRHGSVVEVHVKGHRIVARVVWTRDLQSGLCAQDVLDVAAIVDNRVSTRASATASAGSGSVERRSVARNAEFSVIETFERSRRRAAAFQFVWIGACIAGSAITGSFAIKELLHAPMRQVSANL